jgi:kynureninase
MTAPYEASLEWAAAQDTQDPLGHFSRRYIRPLHSSGQEPIYFCGHSLGLQSAEAAQAVQDALADWRDRAVHGHFEGPAAWMTYHERLAEYQATIVGATDLREVTTMNTLTVNLHLMLVSFYRPTPQRHAILAEQRPFPSDTYALKSQIAWHGFDPATAYRELKARPDEAHLRTEDILRRIDAEGDQIALLLLGAVNYYTGQLFDLPAIIQAAHARGIVVGLDLAHAAGNVPLSLSEWGPDFAVWCTYKYLNGGPGALAGAFVHRRHFGADLPRLTGWWGFDRPGRFQMLPDFVPHPGADGWQISNAPILSMAPLSVSLRDMAAAGPVALRAKSLRLTGYLAWLLASLPGLRQLTPSDPNARGAMLCVEVPGGRQTFDALQARGVVADWREPNIIRLAPAPLYNTFAEVWHLAQHLRAVWPQ